VPKDLGEIASDITITWMQLIAQNRGVSDVEKTLSAENVSRFYSAVCKTVTQCYNFRPAPKKIIVNNDYALAA